MLFDRPHLLPQFGRAAFVHRFRHEDVLVDGHRVLQHPMDRDHVDADELRLTLDLLHRALANMGDELQLQLAGLVAGITRADIARNHLLLFAMKRLVHRVLEVARIGQREAGVLGECEQNLLFGLAVTAAGPKRCKRE